MKITFIIRHFNSTGVNTFCLKLSEKLILDGHEAIWLCKKVTEENGNSQLYQNIVDAGIYITEDGEHNTDYYIFNYADDINAHKIKFSVGSKTVRIVHGEYGIYTKDDASAFDYSFAVNPYLKSMFKTQHYLPNGIDNTFFTNDIKYTNSGEIFFHYGIIKGNPPAIRMASSLEKLPIFLRSETTEDKIKEYILRSDFVCAKGRSAIESVMCGKQVFVYGMGVVDGWLTRESFKAFEYKNFSGNVCSIYDSDIITEMLLNKPEYEDLSDLVEPYKINNVYNTFKNVLGVK